MAWIDTHAHLNDEHFADRLGETLARATDAELEAVLVVGIDGPTSRRALELALEHPLLWAVVGIQPNSLGREVTDDWRDVRTMIESPRAVALGETGLDRYWDEAPIEVQREHFVRHLDLAHELGKPVVIHCREAEADVVAVLTEQAEKTGQPIAGVMHSFAGDRETAQACLKLGLHISFAGMVTFKKSNPLREVAAEVPLDRLLVETDSPYLTPEPHRGKRNEPANVVHTGACLAKVHGIEPSAIAAATTQNAKRLFGLPPT
ncbi:putative deoxyribonuclease YcfH [Planctomycetes bacterium Pan216]|uniref:Putative deoxyribonuclease YcfH n=1 Tax=Kolteria novifilia TaxID=2527975 RepID=A0A518B197_9BACT|nr:putative deoxyribonuclease YcfH [Planctomycetes bacterium Pan216]